MAQWYAVVALTLQRRGDGTALLRLTVEVEPRLRHALIARIAGLVDVHDVRNSASSARPARLSAA